MEIFGSGFVANNLKKIKILKNSNIFSIYAAGVSNSSSNKKKDYIREYKFLKKTIYNFNKKKKFVYISSLSVTNNNLKNDKYVKNKLLIEKYIKKNIENYLIIRLPQLVGKNSNPHTLTNFLYNKIKRREKFKLWNDANRNLIDIDDVIYILRKLLIKNNKVNSIINIMNPRSISVTNIIKILENILLTKAIYKKEIKENRNINFKKFNKNTLLSKKIYKKINSKFYFKKILNKYYK